MGVVEAITIAAGIGVFFMAFGRLILDGLFYVYYHWTSDEFNTPKNKRK